MNPQTYVLHNYGVQHTTGVLMPNGRDYHHDGRSIVRVWRGEDGKPRRQRRAGRVDMRRARGRYHRLSHLYKLGRISKGQLLLKAEALSLDFKRAFPKGTAIADS